MNNEKCIAFQCVKFFIYSFFIVKAFVICKVLMKKHENVSVNYELKIPSNVENDTVKGNGGSVTVKFDDYTFYPQFIVYYTDFESCHVKRVRRRY